MSDAKDVSLLADDRSQHAHAHGAHDECDGGHGHGGASSPAEDAAARRARVQLVTAMVFCFVFMIGEVVGGFLAGSLAIMTDAAHLLSDVAAFLISLFAVWVAARPATVSATWGYHRFEVFGALGSVFLIWIITAILCVEAVQRIINPEPVDGKIMFITATAGLLVNLAMMKILHQGHGHSHGGGHGHSHGAPKPSSSATAVMSGGDEETNLNVRAAFIHVVGDLVQSIGVMIAAALIWAFPSWHIADPICTFLFSILVLFTTTGILRSAAGTLLNGVPAHISLAAIARDLAAIRGVSNVHDLHVWAFGASSAARIALSVHLVADDPAEALLGAQSVAAGYGIKHSTVQVERCGSSDITGCATANVHSDACAITLLPGGGDAGGGAGHGQSHGSAQSSSSRHAGEGDAMPLRLQRPSSGARHKLADGTSHAVSPKATISFDAHGHSHAGGHGHSHGSGAAHGHSHAPKVLGYTPVTATAGGHAHAHGSLGAKAEEAHGHSHAGGDHHGHAHA